MEKSPIEGDQVVTIGLNVNAWDADGVSRRGLCSNYLADLFTPLVDACASGSPIPKMDEITILFKDANEFKLPDDSTKPLVMIGPGVAAFVGFLQAREQLAAGTQMCTELNPLFTNVCRSQLAM